MFTVELKSGRLITIKITAPFGLEDLQSFVERVAAVLTVAPPLIVTCMDLRSSSILAPDIADGLISLMRKDNPRIERTALVMGDNALVNLQVTRMIREAGNPGRRTFHDAEAAEAWLVEALSPTEQAALHAFLNP